MWAYILAALSVVFLLASIAQRVIVSKKYHFAPGPSGFIPLLGAIQWSTRMTKIESFPLLHQKYGKDVYVYFLGRGFFLTTDWNLIKQILDNRAEFPNSSTVRNAFNVKSGVTMFTSEGETWKLKRHTLEPLFNIRVMKFQFNAVLEKVKKFIKILENSPNTLNINPLLNQLTVDSIGSVAFGCDFEALEHPEKQYKSKEGYSDSIVHVFDSVSDAINFRWTWSLPLPIFRREDRSMKILQTLFRSIIESHKSKQNEPVESAASDEPTPEDEESVRFAGLNLISILLDSTTSTDAKGYPYDEAAMLAECFSVFGAGHDTTTRAGAFMYQMLAEHPEVQEKGRKEIAAIAASHGVEDFKSYVPVYEDLNKMKYIENIVKEAMRLYPFPPALLRENSKDVELGGYHIPAGTLLGPSLYAYNHNEELFPSPEKCDPDRWTEQLNRDAKFLSFGYGQRICFGRKFAMMELKLIVFLTLQHYRIDRVPYHPLEIEIVAGLRPKNNESWVTLHPL